MGAALTGALALLLLLSDASGHADVLFFAAAALLLLTLAEIHRMGGLAALKLGLVLLPSALLVLVMDWYALLARDASRLAGPRATPDPGSTHWLDLYAAAALLAISVQGAWLLWLRPRLLGRLHALLIALLLAFVAYLVVDTGGGRAPGYSDYGSRGLLLWLGFPAIGSLVATLAEPAGRARLLAAAGFALWLVPPLPGLVWVWLGYGSAGVAALLLLSKVGDVAGYYVGSAWGRKHPFPRLSPGKTVAGCVGSALGATATGLLLASSDLLLPPGRFGVWSGAAAGILLNLAAQAGDLFESAIKRRAGVKDSGAWFGPSGGVLDLVDSLLFSTPAALLTWPLLFEPA